MSYFSEIDIDNQNMNTLQDYADNETRLRQLIQNFDEYSPEDRERIRRAYTLKQSKTLVMYGCDDDSDLSGSNTNCGNGSERSGSRY